MLWKIYENNILTVLDPMCPLRNFNITSKRDPWIFDDLINEIKQKDFLLKRAKRTKRDIDWTEARTARNQCLRHVRRAKSDFIRLELDQNKTDGRKFWKKY